MNYSIKRISLDIHDTSSRETVYVKRGDTGRVIQIALADGGLPYHISTDCFVVFNGKKPDGTVLLNTCKIENNVITYKLTEQTVAAEGLVKCEVSLYDAGGDLITSPRFNLSVAPKVYNENDELSSSDEFNALKELLKQVQEALDAADAATLAAKLVSQVLAGYVIQEATGEALTLTDAEKTPIVSLRICGKTTQAGVPAPDAPVALVSSSVDDSLTVHVCGKNLFTGWIVGGVNPTDGSDYAVATQRRTDYLPISAPGQKYSVSQIPNTLFNFAAFYDDDKKYISRTAAGPSGGRLVEPPANARYFRISIYENAEATGTIAEADAKERQTMIEVGDTVTEYESGAVQSAAVSTPGGLHGIPVSVGGNYIDESGQRWICDEIDFARGVYIKRVDKIVYDGSSDEYWTRYGTDDNVSFTIWPSKGVAGLQLSLCDRFRNVDFAWGSNYASTYGIYSDHSTALGKYFRAPNETVKTLADWNAWLAQNPTTLLYVMDTPVETALSADEVEAYKALRTYRRYTAVSNDGWAFMDMAYLMDAKKYIASLISEGEFVPGSTVRLGNVTLYASKWEGGSSPYSQVVKITGVTEYSQVDLKPSVEQLAVFHKKDLAFVTENDGGTVTVYAVGDKPTNDYTMQVSITEVNV